MVKIAVRAGLLLLPGGGVVVSQDPALSCPWKGEQIPQLSFFDELFFVPLVQTHLRLFATQVFGFRLSHKKKLQTFVSSGVTERGVFLIGLSLTPIAASRSPIPSSTTEHLNHSIIQTSHLLSMYSIAWKVSCLTSEIIVCF